ncbi:MAG: adenylosuccinate lyase, partial [Anaerolineales bacterium]
MTSFESYQSPFSWRYGSPEMRAIWGEKNKRMMWRKLWVTMAEAQTAWKLVTAEQVQDLKDHMHDVDVSRALEIEKKLHHDLMAEIKVFAEQCPLGGG